MSYLLSSRVYLDTPKSSFNPLTLLPSSATAEVWKADSTNCQGGARRPHTGCWRSPSPPPRQMIWARLLVSVFPVKSRVAPIEINPRWEEHSSIHHPTPNLAGSTRPRQHFNYSDRSNLILYCDAQLGSSLCGTATVVVGLVQDTNKEESKVNNQFA